MSKKTKNYRNDTFVPRSISGKVNFRLVFLFLCIILGFGVITAKLVIVQIVDHGYYADRSVQNVENRHKLHARRGTILDRNNQVLAKDILQYSIALSAKRLKNREKTIRELSRVLNVSRSSIERRILKNSSFTYIAHKVLPKKAEQLKELKEPGLIFEKRFLRIYPFQDNAAHVLGFCDMDNKALGGIEFQYNNFLQGKSGWRIYERDGFGEQLPNLDFPGEDPIDGLDLKLSLDIDFQIVVDDELKQAVKSTQAVDGIAILMDPATGEILALSNYPTFDPAQPNLSRNSVLKNRAISDVVEPGSTFKIVTLAAALEILNINLDKDIYFCENGNYRLFGHQFTDYKPYGWLTARRVFEHSSNVGVVKIAEKLKKETIFNYSRNFGFGIPSGIDLPGESVGILNPIKRFSKTTHLFMSFGYEIGVTPLQLLSAYGVLANGGKLMKTRVMLGIQDRDGRSIKNSRPETIRQVVSQEAAEVMTDVLMGVVKEGTGQVAYLPNLEVAGKTGTAQLYDMEKGTYDSRKHLASFVGYFPATAPRYVLLVMIRQPRGEYYGGLVAAPVFRIIAQRIMSLQPLDQSKYADGRQNYKNLSSVVSPNVVSLESEIAQNILEDAGFDVEIKGEGSFVIKQQEIYEDDKIVAVELILGDAAKLSQLIMPALTGMSLKEALNLLSDINLMADVDGHGMVVSQQPKAGSKIHANKPVKLKCKPS